MNRKNPLLFERDGDLNPTWIFVTVYLAIGAVGASLVLWGGDGKAQIGALTFVGTMTLSLLVSALPRDRAKILAQHLDKSNDSGGMLPDIVSERARMGFEAEDGEFDRAAYYEDGTDEDDPNKARIIGFRVEGT